MLALHWTCCGLGQISSWKERKEGTLHAHIQPLLQEGIQPLSQIQIIEKRGEQRMVAAISVSFCLSSWILILLQHKHRTYAWVTQSNEGYKNVSHIGSFKCCGIQLGWINIALSILSFRILYFWHKQFSIMSKRIPNLCGTESTLGP